MAHIPAAGPSSKRPLTKEGSKDDLEIASSRKKFRYVAPPAPASAPSKTTVPAAAHQHVAPPSPSKAVKSAKAQGKERATTEEEAHLARRMFGQSAMKAGLVAADRDEIARKIVEASKGSAFYNNEEKKSKETEVQVEKMLKRLREQMAQRNGDLSAEEKDVEKLRAELEMHGYDNLDQVVAVADCDAFYASVEELDNPDLKGKAFGVGSGVLTTASYEARKFGCRSGMAGFVAKKLCPHLISVKPDFSKYSAASKLIMDILSRYDANMCPASLDEAYLNITAHVQASGKTPAEVAEEMRAAVKQETGLTISIGVGHCKMIAKIAADVNKPNGQCVISPDIHSIQSFMHSLPVRKIPGIGRVTERWLEALDVRTIEDIWVHRGKLRLADVGMDSLLKAYLGIGSSNVEPGKRENRKSVGTESTFSTIHEEEKHYAKLRYIADSLAEDLERTKFSGRTITLKIKLDTYDVYTRAHSTSAYISSADDLYRIGKQLLEKEIQTRYALFDAGKKVKGSKGCRELRLRLMGLRATNLRDESEAAREKRASMGVKGLDKWTRVTSPNKNKETPSNESPDAEEEDEIECLEVSTSKPAKRKMHDTSNLPSSKKPKTVVNPLTCANVLQAVECPSCAEAFDRVSLAVFNQHLDDCLNPKSKKVKKQKSGKKGKDAFAMMAKAASKSVR